MVISQDQVRMFHKAGSWKGCVNHENEVNLKIEARRVVVYDKLEKGRG